VTIRGNVIADVARSMFDLEPNTEGNTVRAIIRIEQNTTWTAVNFWIASKGAGNQIGDVVVRDIDPDDVRLPGNLRRRLR
jgi:hypothetical protein